MGIVAPISAASPVVPLLVDLGRGVRPARVAVARHRRRAGGIVLLAREPGGAPGSSRLATGVTLALVAALGFGLFVVGLDAAADASVPWTIVAVGPRRRPLALVLALVARVTLRPPARLLPLIVAVGVFDTVANVLVAYAVTLGSAGVVAVLSALYPVTTILLARLVLGERLDGARRLGAGLALGGAAVAVRLRAGVRTC